MLADTLIYELCTDKRETFWPAIQRKLFRFADSIEVWDHIGPLGKREIRDQRPLIEPVQHELTALVREWFRREVQFVPPDLRELAAAYMRAREQRNVCSLIKACRAFCVNHPKMTQEFQKDSKTGKKIAAAFVADIKLLNDNIRRDHGNVEDQELYIQEAENGLGPEWFAYHHQKSVLALYAVFMLKYGLTNKPGKDFRHTKLDSDYVALLHYADALATNETAGSLSDMCSWMYGTSKLVFSTHDLDRSLPFEDETRVCAYYRWLDQGAPEGEDRLHWFWAQDVLLSRLWERLEAIHLSSATGKIDVQKTLRTDKLTPC